MTFNNPIAALSGALTFPSIHSPDYTTSGGSTGWTINRDGTASFNTLGGSVQITNTGVFFYVPTAGIGNLFMSLSNADGVDPYGNSYHKGMFINQHQGWFTSDAGHSVVINPDGSTGPQLLFFPSGFNAIMHMLVEGPANRLLFEPLASSNAAVEFNGPVIATGGIEGEYTQQGATPPLNATGIYTEYLTASWAPVTIVCPPSETVHVTMQLRGHNQGTVNASVGLGFNVKQGATVLFTPTNGNISQNGPYINNDGVSARLNDGNTNMTMVVGNSILAGRNGQTLTFTPMWRTSASGTGAISFGSMLVTPQMFRCQQSSVA